MKTFCSRLAEVTWLEWICFHQSDHRTNLQPCWIHWLKHQIHHDVNSARWTCVCEGYHGNQMTYVLPWLPAHRHVLIGSKIRSSPEQLTDVRPLLCFLFSSDTASKNYRRYTSHVQELLGNEQNHKIITSADTEQTKTEPLRDKLKDYLILVSLPCHVWSPNVRWSLNAPASLNSSVWFINNNPSRVKQTSLLGLERSDFDSVLK